MKDLEDQCGGAVLASFSTSQLRRELMRRELSPDLQANEPRRSRRELAIKVEAPSADASDSASAGGSQEGSEGPEKPPKVRNVGTCCLARLEPLGP